MKQKITGIVLVLGLLLTVGCVQVDEPLVDLGGYNSSPEPAPSGSIHQACQSRIQSLDRELARYKRKYQEKDDECERLEDKLEKCEDKLDD